jgi:ATP-dependent DNA ligase
MCFALYVLTAWQKRDLSARRYVYVWTDGVYLQARLQSTFRRRRRDDLQACVRARCEGIVSKRLGSVYRAGRVDHWLKIKNPAAPAVRREVEEDWGGKRWARGRRFS